MILLVHHNGKIIGQILKDDQRIEFDSIDFVSVFWEVATKFPEELICWVEKSLLNDLNIGKLEEIFYHDLIMASYAVKSKFLPESIGYVDQLPFINVDSAVRYPTWRMSSDVGGINAKTLLRFKEFFSSENSFDGLLNSIAKLGQQNELFCYSDPALLKLTTTASPKPIATSRQLFGFVKQHYKSIWVFVLFWCLWHYERKFYFWPLLISLFERKYFKKQIDLPKIKMPNEVDVSDETIDVLIPTIGRPQHLLQVVKDLKEQTLLPKRVIIIEQDPDPESVSELSELEAQEWPFEIIHHFTHRTGACMARNAGLKEVKANWVFLADDDIRIPKDLFEKSFVELYRLGADCLNYNCRQPGEGTVFKKIKQWGSFGSGTSIVKSRFVHQNDFSEVFEHGYGEDADYGMKLRASGCDIIYHPDLQIQHLKAPMGGFRKKPVLDWEKEDPLPKPAPTLMIFAKKYFTREELKGFKISLFLKYYGKQKKQNLVSYYREMNKRWKRSEFWAEKLIEENPKKAVSV